MNEEDLDFGNGGNPTVEPPKDTDATKTSDPVSEPNDINGGEPEKDTTDKDEQDGDKKSEEKTDTDKDSSTGGLEEGTEVEFDGNTYTVDKDGNLVDKDGNIFKKADEVDAFIKENGIEEEADDNSISIDKVREAIGVDVVDENGNSVEFTNDVEGIKSYINSVVDIKTADVQDAVINKFYQDNPLVKNFVDYVTVNGTYEGFGTLRDRSNIVLDKDNQTQLEAVIRMAAQEFGNASLSDNYIAYLRDNGGLYDEATVQLQNLVDYDARVRKEITERAELARQKEAQEVEEYWKRVDNVVKSRKIGNYQIPESFTKEVDGKKVMYNIADFYNYLSKAAYVDENGNKITAYQKDLAAMSDDDLLNNEILDAYLHFTGGTYNDLVKMAVKEEEVRKLKLKAKEHRVMKAVKINKPSNKSNSSVGDIALA